MSVTGRRNGAERGWSLAMRAAPAQLQQCWHILSAKSHFSSVDETKMNSVGPLVCLWGRSKLEKGWLNVLAHQYSNTKQDKQLFSFPRFYGMTVEESTSPSQGGPGPSIPVLPQLAPLVLQSSHSQKSNLPPAPSLWHPPCLPIQKARRLWKRKKNWKWSGLSCSESWCKLELRDLCSWAPKAGQLQEYGRNVLI